jgi:hypothetical protein
VRHPNCRYLITGCKVTWFESVLIPVTTPIRSWTVDRRYNDFVALHAELMSSTNKIPPAALPPKHPWSLTRSAYDEKVSGSAGLDVLFACSAGR